MRTHAGLCSFGVVDVAVHYNLGRCLFVGSDLRVLWVVCRYWVCVTRVAIRAVLRLICEYLWYSYGGDCVFLVFLFLLLHMFSFGIWLYCGFKRLFSFYGAIYYNYLSLCVLVNLWEIINGLPK